MSNRRIAGISLGLAVAAFLAAALTLVAAGVGLSPGAPPREARWSGSETAPREVRLVARSTAFYLPGDATPNPTLRFAPGERVRVVLVNEDSGMDHDVVAPALGLATPLVQGAAGGAEAVSGVIRMPDRPGTHEYECSLHPVLMRGVIEVR